MWKLNLGFVFALLALGLGGLGAYNNVQQLLSIVQADDDPNRAADATVTRLMTLRENVRSAASVEDAAKFVETARGEEASAANRRAKLAGAVADQTRQIILAASLLALLITVVSIVMINRDVSAREDMEMRLALAHANLEARVRERTAELDRSNKELEKHRTDLGLRVQERTADLHRANDELKRVTAGAEAANRAKSEFLANMSHELRTPLNSVIGFTNILLKNKGSNLRPQDITFLERVLDNGKHLLQLINEVLDLAKVEAGRMEVVLQTVDLGELVRSTLASLEGQIKGKDVQLIAEVPPQAAHCEADPGKLKQVLINLVGNAIKFTEHGSVRVRVETDPADGRPTALDVIDTGIGIPQEKLNTIFEAFQQGDASTTRHYGGTGLGLTIARSLCGLMGYEIEVRSRVGHGSAFRILLGTKDDGTQRPASVRSLTAEILLPRERTGETVALKDKRVLIIDDDSDSRILLTQYIEDFGCRTLAVDCGEQGVRLSEQFEPDLIVLDLMMPGMNGWDVLKALKSHPTLSNVPVVVVSIVANESRGSILGAVDLLDKPVSRDSLHAMLQRTLQSRKGRALVVDDHADSRQLVTAYLHEEGFETCEAANGADALERLERFDADLIILDLMMPVMDGLSFLAALRRDARYLRLPVVVVTAKDLTQQESQHLGENNSVILRKGDELAQGLKRVVGEVLGRRPA